jgi:K(+)-stimulated pyrophosphate-energized sodium pump
MELSLIFGISILGLLFAVYLISDVLKRDTGSAKMQEISNAIKQGAEAFLRRQNRTILWLALCLAAFIYIMYAFIRTPTNSRSR